MLWVILPATLLLCAACGTEDAAGPDQNHAPEIAEISWSPTAVEPATSVTFTVEATDADEDSLIYGWSAEAGTFTSSTELASAAWTSPATVGPVDIYLAVTDGQATVLDTVTLLIAIDLTASITSPVDSTFYIPGSSVTFRGMVAGYSDLDSATVSIRWESDVDSLLSRAAVNSSGITTFTTSALSDTVHRISLTATVNDTLIASDTVVVNYHKPTTPTLYDAERGYTSNRLSWRADADTSRFLAYVLYRQEEEGTEEELVRIGRADSAFYTDSNVLLGQRYIYRVETKNSFGATTTSDTTSIITGVFLLVESSTIGEMTFGTAPEYLFASITDKDKLYVLDVTGNNLDHSITVGDAPKGICANTSDDKIYVANSSDNSVSVIAADDPSNTNLAYEITLPGDPLFLDYFEADSVLYTTMSGNDYPLIIRENADGTATVDTLQDTRLRLIQEGSMIRVDDTNQNLYITEIGNFAAGLWKYSISFDGTAPSFSASIAQGALGYGLQEIAIRPPAANQLLVASTSPYVISIVNAATLLPTDSLETGPYPNAVTVDPTGSTAYISLSSSDVQVWDLDTGVQTSTISFSDPVNRGGVEINPDGTFLAVATYNSLDSDSRIFLIYLP